jgi:hypothetical protein
MIYFGNLVRRFMCKKYLLSGVCCALLSWSGIVSGMMMEDGGKIENREEHAEFKDPFSNMSFGPISTNFPCFLGSIPTPSEWPRALANIAKNVEVLNMEQYANKLPLAFTAIDYLTSCDFAKLVTFCESDSCDPKSREILFSLFLLVPKILRTSRPHKGKKRLLSDFTRFLDNIQPTRPLVSASDEALFCRVSEMI